MTQNLLVTRRVILRISALTIGSIHTLIGQGANSFPELARELKDRYLLALSPDGKTVCVGSKESRVNSYVLKEGRGASQLPRSKQAIVEFVDLSTGTVVYQRTFKEGAFPASFFADGRLLYLETGFFNNGGSVVQQRATIDWKKGEVHESVSSLDSSTAFGFHALQENVLLTQGYNPLTKLSDSLIQVSLPDYKEVRRVAYATGPRETRRPFDHQKFFSADRKFVAYGFDHVIVFRRTSDLSVLWTHPIDQGSIGAWRMAVSADGRFVAAAITDSGFSNKEKKYGITVYSGNDGTELSTLSVSGTDGLAVSPDGQIVAAAHILYNNRGAIPTVLLYRVSTGEYLGALEHTPVTQNAFMNASFGIHGIEFSSDGKYLITSSGEVRVWRLPAA